MTCEYARKHYGVPARVGRRITYRDRPGIISEDRGHYIGVTFDDEKPGTVSNFHPRTEGLEYGEVGEVRRMTRSQRRYQEFLAADRYPETFADWLGIKRVVNP